MGIWRRLFGGSDNDPGDREPSGPPAPASLKQRFRDLAIDIASEIDGIDRVEAGDELQLCVYFEDRDEPAIIGLSSVFASSRDMSPDERHAELERHLRLCVSPPKMPTTWREAKRLVVPVVRSHHYFGVGPDLRPVLKVQRSFVSPLDEVLTVQLPGAMAFVDPQDLERWGVTADEAFARGRKNLKGMTEGDCLRLDNGLWVLECEDDLAASRLLLTPWWRSVIDECGGQPAVIVPDQSTVWVGNCFSEEAVLRLLEKARREHEAARRAISPAVYTVTPDHEVFVLNFHKFERLSRKLAAAATALTCQHYDQQAAFVEAALNLALASEQPVPDELQTFVPRVMAIGDQSGIATHAIVVAEIDNLVPEVGILTVVTGPPLPTVIAEIGGNIEGNMAPEQLPRPSVSYWWTDVFAHFGIRLTPEEGWNPPRYRLTAAMIDELLAYCGPAGPGGPLANDEGQFDPAEGGWQSRFVGIGGPDDSRWRQ